MSPEAEQQRRDRARLLRDFETTRLTTANFCVLKRIAPAELESQLALARHEAAESPRPERVRPAEAPSRHRR